SFRSHRRCMPVLKPLVGFNANPGCHQQIFSMTVLYWKIHPPSSTAASPPPAVTCLPALQHSVRFMSGPPIFIWSTL
ncbi:hypothetical protein ILYODFUR_019052, partial [Ilyodon furcidens]